MCLDSGSSKDILYRTYNPGIERQYQCYPKDVKLISLKGFLADAHNDSNPRMAFCLDQCLNPLILTKPGSDG